MVSCLIFFIAPLITCCRGLIRLQMWWVGGIAIRFNFGGIQLVWHLMEPSKGETNQTPLDVKPANRTEMLRGKRLLIGCGGGFQQECSQPCILLLTLIVLGILHLGYLWRLFVIWALNDLSWTAAWKLVARVFLCPVSKWRAGEADPSASFWYSGCTYGFSAQRHLGSLLQKASLQRPRWCTPSLSAHLDSRPQANAGRAQEHGGGQGI